MVIVLISDTSMRFGEVAGLLKEDINVNEPTPYRPKPYPWWTLRTKKAVYAHTLPKGLLGFLTPRWAKMIVSLPLHVTAMKQTVKLTQPVAD